MTRKKRFSFGSHNPGKNRLDCDNENGCERQFLTGHMFFPGVNAQGQQVFLKDIWPTRDEIQAVERQYVIPGMFKEVYQKIEVRDTTVHTLGNIGFVLSRQTRGQQEHEPERHLFPPLPRAGLQTTRLPWLMSLQNPLATDREEVWHTASITGFRPISPPWRPLYLSLEWLNVPLKNHLSVKKKKVLRSGCANLMRREKFFKFKNF